jgi:hypothetical protein
MRESENKSVSFSKPLTPIFSLGEKEFMRQQRSEIYLSSPE